LSTSVKIIAEKYKYSSWWAQVLFIYKKIRLVLKGVQEQLIGFLEKTCMDKYVGCKVYLHHGKDFVFMMDSYSLQKLD
jgi:hypothetical protein